MKRLKRIMFATQAVISVIYALVIAVLSRDEPFKSHHPNLSFYQENLQEDQWGIRLFGAALLFILASGLLAFVFIRLIRRENNKLECRPEATSRVQS